jgi:hypothetical protein
MPRLKRHSTNDFRTQVQQSACTIDIASPLSIATSRTAPVIGISTSRGVRGRQLERRLVRSFVPVGCVGIATLGQFSAARGEPRGTSRVSFVRRGASITKFVRNDPALIFTIYRIARDNDVLDRIYSDL